MRVVIQRVLKSSITIDKNIVASIGPGMLLLVSFTGTDTRDDLEWIAGKIIRLRIFDDEAGVMNLPVTDIGGEIMIVSQFTLHAKTKKGNRPSYIDAAVPEIAIPLYNSFVELVQALLHGKVMTGRFGAEMQVELLNDGPVTIIIDSKNRE
jgi:D-tyrosyl-tRNA(Tyr) deacylase